MRLFSDKNSIHDTSKDPLSEYVWMTTILGAALYFATVFLCWLLLSDTFEECVYGKTLPRPGYTTGWSILPMLVTACGGEWAACRDRNDLQPPGSSYVSGTALF